MGKIKKMRRGEPPKGTKTPKGEEIERLGGIAYNAEGHSCGEYTRRM
jgi:hypothetical protein